MPTITAYMDETWQWEFREGKPSGIRRETEHNAPDDLWQKFRQAEEAYVEHRGALLAHLRLSDT